MSSLETFLITATALVIALAPRAIDAWLAVREESHLEFAVGGAE